MNGKVSTVIEPFTVNDVTGGLWKVNWKAINRDWDHLRGASFPQTNSRNESGMLIGMDYPDLHFFLKDIRRKPCLPIARLTPLGWSCKSKQHCNKLAPKPIRQNLF